MCIHQRYVYNKQTHKSVLVKCGRCEQCQLEKSSMRLCRLSNNYDAEKYFVIFVTNNYSNSFVPYIKVDEFDGECFTFYRQMRVRRVRNGEYKYYDGEVKLGTYYPVSPSDMRRCHEECNLLLPQKFDKPGCVAVLYHKDFQDYIKRFKKYCKDHYDIDLYNNENYSYYKVGEYGPSTLRPHFHSLHQFSVKYKGRYNDIIAALVSCWPLCSREQMEQNVELAVKPFDYVSKYTVRPSGVPALLQVRKISSTSSFSRGFGFVNDAFSPSSILQAVEQRIATYCFEESGSDGLPVKHHYVFPKYVADRYFPRFKGRYQLGVDALRSVLCNPHGIVQYIRTSDYYTEEDVKQTVRRLYAAAERLDLDMVSYSWYYIRFYDIRFSYVYGSFVEGMQHSPLLEYYDLGFSLPRSSFRSGKSSFLFTYDEEGEPLYYTFDEVFQHLNPNTNPVLIDLDANAKVEYDKCLKKRKFNDYVNHLNYVYVEYKPKNLAYGKHFKKSGIRCSSSSLWT